MKKVILIFKLICIMISVFMISENAFSLTQRPYREGEEPPPSYVLGIGISPDFVYSNDYDFDLYLSAKYGELGYIGYFLNVDFGYRFREETLRGKFGGSMLFSNFGLQFDFAYSINYNIPRFDPGVGYSFVFVIPIEPAALFINLGGQTMSNHNTEFVAGLTLFYSFTHFDLIANIFD